MADGYAYTASYNEGEEPPPLPVGPPDIAPNTPVQLPGGVWGIRTEGAPAGGGAQDQRDLEFQRNLLKNVRVQDAAKAVESAMRFQGMRGYERDLQAAQAAGLSPEQAATQALVRNSGKMFFSHPQSLVPAIRSLRQPPAVMPPTLVDLGGGVRGVQAGIGGAQFHPLPQPKPVVEGKLSDVEKARIRQLEKRQASLDKELSGPSVLAQDAVPEFKAQNDKKRAELESLNRQLSQIGQPAKEAKQLTADLAKQFLKQAGGDKAKARKLARDAGYTF